jgi:hypothetical protein
MVHLEIFHRHHYLGNYVCLPDCVIYLHSHPINVKNWMPTMTEGRGFFYSNAIHHLAQSECLAKQKQPFSSTDPFGVHINCAYLQVQTRFHLFQGCISPLFYCKWRVGSSLHKEIPNSKVAAHTVHCRRCCWGALIYKS